MPSPPITASQSQAYRAGRGRRQTHARRVGQRDHRTLQRPERGAQDVVAVDPGREATATETCAVAQILSKSLSRSSAVRRFGIVDAARNAVGIENHRGRHHRTGQRPAAGLVAARNRPDAALDQRALAAEARRGDGDDALPRPFWLRLPSWRFLADLSQIMAGIVRKRHGLRNREPRTIPVIQPAALFRQMHPPVLADLDARRDHDLPGMAVGIGEIAGIAAVVGLMRGLQQRRALADGERQNRIDLLRATRSSRRASCRGSSMASDGPATWRRPRADPRETAPSTGPPVSKKATASPVRFSRTKPSAS